MIKIRNEEQEICSLMLVDMKGRIYCETLLEPLEKLTLDIGALLSGIYMLVFKTDHTSYTQQIVKY